ncbi:MULTISPECIES: PEP-CTERM sorting domain-containing protein [unclassified Massilia]|uniref:PEP-CTERM sorting domain-containing protein n=1 Tax=unclassified Massilia TaxID=2609279 RepID=UPI00177EE8ED|nr:MULTISPECIES: PEP-CTERM sorting domain-containing protein [unclassified Massilia]MBD8528595.1 PEP-CTERM sorting domain-containing protein [Massilia sp. CFBP 13647]MBD8671782.1 PEP-CTERM sorting domain-containing protein [Massilia sp. CFBP 13721]
MSLSSLPKLLASLSFFACSSLFAAPIVINVAGIQSIGEFGDAANPVFTYNVGANATITNVSYSVNVTAFSPSYLSEISFAITDSGVSDGVLFTPGFEDDNAGTASYTATTILADEGLSFSVGADGILRVEFYDAFDDGAVNPDGIWNFGTITIAFEPDVDVPVDPGPGTDVPEPASALLLGVGALAMGYGRRRRAAKAVH